MNPNPPRAWLAALLVLGVLAVCVVQLLLSLPPPDDDDRVPAPAPVPPSPQHEPEVRAALERLDA